MSLLAISYPILKPEDFDWIQAIRSKHDGLYYKLIRPHFTLVFPVLGMGGPEFINHVRSVAGNLTQIPFVLRRVEVTNGRSGGYWFVMLVPDEGYADIVNLHDRLNEGLKTEERTNDYRYVPHITVGNSQDQKTCQTVAQDLSGNTLSIDGRISAIDVIAYDNNRIETIAKIELPR